MMEKAIRDFPKQFEFKPVVERADQLQKKPAAIVSGMGGSHLAADLLKSVYSDTRLIVHSDYSLPSMREEDLQKCLFIANSYSGNTEEVISGLEEAKKRGILSAAVSVGGRLMELAAAYELPYIQIPDTGIQPRMALGFGMIALMKFLSMETEIQELHKLADILSPDDLEEEGKRLSVLLYGKVPVIYASMRNQHIAANWKIKCNETGKIPAFYNMFPELNHNEMTGFDATDRTRELSRRFHFIFLRDTEDDPRVQKRMDICKKLYEDRGLPVVVLEMQGASRAERAYTSLLIADWFAFHAGMSYGAETEQVPMVEEFKKRMRDE